MPETAADLVHALREEGLRITKARRAICEVLGEAPDAHLTAADIRERAQEIIGTRIDESTVYRTLDTLEERGYLHHIHPGHAPGVIHLSVVAEHHHLVCEDCGRIVDVPIDELEPLLEGVAAEHGFIIDSVHFALMGRCWECGWAARMKAFGPE